MRTLAGLPVYVAICVLGLAFLLLGILSWILNAITGAVIAMAEACADAIDWLRERL